LDLRIPATMLQSSDLNEEPNRARHIGASRSCNVFAASQARMSDAYRLIVNEATVDPATAAARIFARAPWWVRTLMALRNRLVRPLGLKTGFDEKTRSVRRIDPFPIVTETAERVLLGLDDKHLDFRVAVDVVPFGEAHRQITTQLWCARTICLAARISRL
jgi:Protein of unknown function (DUF2867)